MSSLSNPLPPKTFWLFPSNELFVMGESRHVKDRRSLGYLNIFMLLGFELCAIVLFVDTAYELVRWGALEYGSVVTTGEFIERHTSLADVGLDYYVTFRYSNNDVVYQTEERIDQALYDHSEVGGKAEVRFVPFDPQMAVIQGTNQFNVLIVLIMLSCGGFVVLTIPEQWKLVRMRCLLERQGFLLDGTIIASDTSTDEDGNLLHIDFSFAPPGADPIIGKAAAVRNDLKNASLPTAGAGIHVLYRNPHHYMLL